MEIRVGQVVVHYVEHGTGQPVLVLHGAGVDHREAAACFEPVFDGRPGLRRIYPDLPGMGRTIAPETLRSADDVLDTLLDFADEVMGGTAHLLIGHSAGGYYAQAMAARRPGQVAGLALVCPLLPELRDVPEHRVVAGSGQIGDDVFRSYFVIQTPQMLERYERYVAPAAALLDRAALERIGERWALTPAHAPAYPGPTVVVAGRLDSTVGYAAATDVVDDYTHASLAVVDDAGHALPHEQPELPAPPPRRVARARRALELTRNRLGPDRHRWRAEGGWNAGPAPSATGPGRRRVTSSGVGQAT
jgi:pimeloyl-ACP methyl ester carboxylesterase